MNIRTVLGVGALFLAAAMPATSLGQRVYSNRSYGIGNSYRGGGYLNRNYGYNRGYGYGYNRVTPIRIGGATVYFGPGGGNYGYSAPVFGYSYPYPAYGGYYSPLGYGYPSYYGGYGY